MNQSAKYNEKNPISIIVLLCYCLHTNFICILSLATSKCSNKHCIYKVGRFIRGEVLIRGGALILMWIHNGAAFIRGWHLFKARRLLEEIRYPNC